MRLFHTFGGLDVWEMPTQEIARQWLGAGDDHDRCVRCEAMIRKIRARQAKDREEINTPPAQPATYYVPALQRALCAHYCWLTDMGWIHWELTDEQRASELYFLARMNRVMQEEAQNGRAVCEADAPG